MDKERQKRKQSIRIAVTESIMVVAVVAIVALLMFMVMGYSLQTGGDNWSVEQSGLVQLVSTPSGASIEIDGEGIFQRTETSRMLSEGEHTIKLTRDDYDSWSKTINVRPGVFLRLKYPRLFKNNRESEQVKTFENLDKVYFANNRNSLLYTVKDSPVWHWVSLKKDNLTETEIDTAEIFSGEVTSLKWVGNGEKLLLKVTKDDAATWLVVDLKTPEKSVNLTETFGMNFESVAALNTAADKLWALENGNLRILNTSSKESSGVLAANVVSFTNNWEELVYVARAENGERTIYAYKEGYNKGVKVKKVTDAEASIKVAVEEYLGDVYLSYAVGQEFTSFRADEFPAEGQKFEMEEVLKQTLAVLPEKFAASDNGQFVIMASGERLAVMDAETEQLYEYAMGGGQYFWLDDYLIGEVVEGELTVWDFDGTNQRKITKASGDYPAIISVNGRWLYYFTVKDEKVNLNREQL